MSKFREGAGTHETLPVLRAMLLVVILLVVGRPLAGPPTAEVEALRLIAVAFSKHRERTASGAMRICFARAAQCSVFAVSPMHMWEGVMFAIMEVWQRPARESFRICVSFEFRKGTWRWAWTRALMHPESASRERLMLVPSWLR